MEFPELAHPSKLGQTSVGHPCCTDQGQSRELGQSFQVNQADVSHAGIMDDKFPSGFSTVPGRPSRRR